MKLPKQIYVSDDEEIVGQFNIAEITRHHDEVDMARKLQLAYNSHDELVASLKEARFVLMGGTADAPWGLVDRIDSALDNATK